MAKKPTFNDLSLGIGDYDNFPTSTTFTVYSDGTWTESYFPHRDPTITSGGQLTDNEFRELNKLYAKVENNKLPEPLLQDVFPDTGQSPDTFVIRSNSGTEFHTLADDGFGDPYYYYAPKVVDPLKDYLLSLDAKYGFPLFI
jgi:hypothetical protein